MSDATAVTPARQYKPVSERKPIRQLDGRGEELVRLMTFGLDDDEAAVHGLPANKALDLKTAAPIAGLKQKNARFVFASPPFLKAYSQNLAAIKSGHKAKAVETLADIMTDEADNSAATKAVRVKAAQTLLGDSESRTGNTNIALQVNNGPTLAAGIVVRIGHDIPMTPLEQRAEATPGDVIDGELIDAPDDEELAAQHLEAVARQNPVMRGGGDD